MSKLSVKHFELLTQGTHVSWNYTVKQKNAQNVRERRKNNFYLVFADKNGVFLFFAQEAHVPLKEPQNNRRLSE